MKFSTFPPNADLAGRKGVVKFGIDPTASRLHLGHLLPLKLLKQFQNKGNEIVLILGDFTATLGDPSGKDTSRPILSLDVTRSNAEAFMSIVSRILGTDITIWKNSTWLSSIPMSEVVQILAKFSVNELLSRDSFQLRQANQNPIGMHELIVPILQGLDSVHVNADIEIGGTDQLFNFQISRKLQELNNQLPQVCIFSPILNGLDGRKMSKSFNNCIWLDDTPKDVFGKTMSISDELMFEWLDIFCDNIDRNQHPMALKKHLAFAITADVWDVECATRELQLFEGVFQNKSKVPDNIPLITGSNVIELVCNGMNISHSAAKRLINSNAVSINGIKITTDAQFENGDLLKIGKINFFKIIK